MDADKMQGWLERCREIAREAGEKIRQVAAEGVEATDKEDGSPLTRADTASHETIDAGLTAMDTGLPILSEEGDLENVGGAGWSAFWCVDPLDGTKEFVKGLDEYTVNIALIRDATPVMGVVYVPAKDLMYSGGEGIGAFKAVGDQPASAIRANAVEKPASAVASRSHLSDETKQFLEQLGVKDVVSHGSSIKIVAIAEGTADIYPRHGPTCLWDTAAGAAVARAAGCRVTDLAGDDLSYDPNDGIKRPGFLVYPEPMDATVRAVL